MKNISTNELMAIQNVGDTCCNCLKETEVFNIYIGALGWGSNFDNFSTQIDLCIECLAKTNPKWWELKICGNHDKYGNYNISGEWYEFENEIIDFVKQMPLAGQELFWNRYAYGTSAYTIKAQDWIDCKLGILPHEECKKYGLYSLQEIQTYKEKFPNCNYPINIIYNDNSKGCRCIFGASGEYGQKIGLNIHGECYKCEYHIKRYEPIREMTNIEFEKYKKSILPRNSLLTLLLLGNSKIIFLLVFLPIIFIIVVLLLTI